MRIAIVGCGALGSFYGAKLARAGLDVHFLLRSDYEVVRRRGVSIVSPDGNFNARPRCARLPGEIGPVDLVVIGLKTTANDQFPILLPPLVHSATAILTLQNGLGSEEALAALFAPGQILGGLCFVCLNRVEPGVIQHLAHGGVTLGEFGRWPEPRTHDVASLFKSAGVPCHVTDNLARAHWEKLVWNIPFNGLGVASTAGQEAVLRGSVAPDAPRGPCLATDVLLADAIWERLVRELMAEVVAGARALGLEIDAELIEAHLVRTRSMGAYKASTLGDFERGRPLELESLFLAPLRLARAAGVPTPRWENLCRLLVQLGSSPPA